MFNNRPLLLAPMEDITDSAFRSLCKKNGADIVCSEFISADGLIRNIEKSLLKIKFEEAERPYGVQIFGSDADKISEAAQIVEQYNPDYIDLNFGCPVKKIVNKGGGAALLNDIPKMIKITESVVKRVKIPVTAKTRLGWDSHSKNIEDVAERLQDAGIKALTIHGRTKVQMYSGIADWTLIGQVKNNKHIHIPIFGNGDIDSAHKAFEYLNRYNIDGLMIGRAAIGNPWIFNEIKYFLKNGNTLAETNISDRIISCLEFLNLSIKVNDERKGILKIRRHYSGFFKGLRNFKPYRLQLVTADTKEKIQEIFDNIKRDFIS